jgi:hypothetical protein
MHYRDGTEAKLGDVVKGHLAEAWASASCTRMVHASKKTPTKHPQNSARGAQSL